MNCPNRDEIIVDKFYNEQEREIVLDLALEKNPKLIRFYTPGMKAPKGFHYRSYGDNKIVTSLHHGQRKLFLSELQFLTSVLKKKDQAVTVLYVGAAPGTHLKFLSRLFPNVEFYLYDPARFIIPGSKDKMHIFNQFFTDETAKQWSGKCDLFISDIRRSEGKEDSDLFERLVAEDMEMQQEWVRMIRPRLGALLKFRPPYIEPGVRMTKTYLAGKVMIQTWPPRKSTETRLIVPPAPAVGKRYATMRFPVHEYQDWMTYHNYGRRIWMNYNAPAPVKSVPGYDGCFDCTNEAQSWLDYTKKYKVKASVASLMNRLTKEIGQRLISTKEGSLHGKYSNIPMCKRRSLLLKDI
jgi:hypothetical protein